MRPLIIDSFAGGGGASTGIEMALGRSPDIAINHSAAALALHAANHPETLHISENIYRVDPLDYVKGRRIGLAWFSPDCKHFSKAKGGTPVARNIRDLAHVIPHWVERTRKGGGSIDVVIMENVEEFSTWGPVIETERGLMPCPDRRGETFELWCKKLRKLGGKLEKRELRGCDYGAPTIRKRLFVVVRFDGQEIIWPEPTHGAPDDPDVIAGRKLPWRTAAEIIDWSLPCPSIFDSAEAIMAKHGLRAVRPLADNTLARVARGMKRYVLDAERPFIVNLTHGGRCEDLAQPFNTITGAHRGEKAIVTPYLVPRYGERNGQSPRSRSLELPMPVVVPSGNGGSLVAPVLSYAQQGGGNRPVDEPVHTICANLKDQNQVIIPTLVGCGGRAGQSRPRGGDEPMATVTAKADTVVAAVFMAQHNGDPRKNGEEAARPGRSVDQPLATVTARGTQQQAVAAFLAQNNYMEPGHDARDPVSTIVGRGSTQGVVAPFLQKYYGTGDGSGHDEPCHTVTTKDRHGHVEAELSVPPFSPEQEDRAREVAAFLRAHGFWDEREFVTFEVDGVTLVIVDIGMRMLTPRELYNAQGFPPDYEIERGLDGSIFPKSVQVSCVGNSVCPPVAAALVAANCGWLAEERMAAE